MVKKILQIIPYSYHIHLGGLEKIAQTLSDGLNKYDEIELKNRSSDVIKGGMINESIQSDTIFMQSFDLISGFPVPKIRQKQFWKQWKILRDWKPSVIVTHTRFFLQSMLGGICAKLRGCKRIHIEHGSGFVQGYPRWIRIPARFFDRTVGIRIFRQCDTIVTISQIHKQFIRKFTAKEPVVIYNPIDFIPQRKVSNQIPHIGFIGRLVALKGVDLLIKALSALQQKERTCTIVGEGPERKNLEELVITFGLTNRVQFVGADDRANRLHRFDIFVNPSYQEGVPTTVVEALLAGCVVVATDVGGTREISLEDDLILVDKGSSEKLREGIVGAYYRLELSGKSYEGVMQRFGVGSAMKQWRTLIKEPRKNSRIK